ncbi:MAG: hypothetical protein M1118_06270 [Chloroflexi bacterium]|nr:hypothetical protein [Chloroflexota bacterium]
MGARTLRARAPIRLDFTGGWTDVPPLPQPLVGRVLAGAIPLFATVTLEALPTGKVSLASEDYGEHLEATDADDLAYDGHLDLPKAALKRLGPHTGIAVRVHSDAPPGSGTGLSAAVAVALVVALTAWQGQPLPSTQLASLARHLESVELHNAVGWQDQFTATFGGVNLWEFRDSHISGGRLPVEGAVLLELEQRLLLCYSGRAIQGLLPRFTALPASPKKLPTLCYVRTSITLAPSYERTGRSSDASTPASRRHRSTSCLPSLLPRVPSGKALGAGGGGCLIFCCHHGSEAGVRAALVRSHAVPLRWNFWHRGIEVWRSPLR